MNSQQPDDRLPDATAERRKMNLQCIGSFKAYTQDGETYVVDIFTHFGAVHDRERMRVQPTLLVLTTKDGRAVERVAQGEYRLSESPEISFSTDDPNAP
jgi:hypothetical protein